MYRDVGMAVPKTTETRCRDRAYKHRTNNPIPTVIPLETGFESLVQVTVVAGPPVEIQVRVNCGFYPLRSEVTVNVIPPGILTSPAEHKEAKDTIHWKSIS